MFAHPGKKLNFMGSEFGQFKEWAFEESVEFFMLQYDLHKKLWEFNKFLNNIYKENSELFEIEDSWDGFRWISADERDNNIISFERINKKGEKIAVIMNFSGNSYDRYRLGLDKGLYTIILNSDEKKFGGNGVIKTKTYKTAKKYAHGRENSIQFKLPAFTALYLKKNAE